MELKNYQKHVLNDLNRYCELVVSTGNVSRAYKSFWEEKNIAVGFHGLRPYQNTIENTPHVCFKVPTGGGKTFLACNSLKVIFNNMPAKRIRLVVWLIPSEAILSQTLQTLSDTSHPYRQAVDTDFNGQVQIYSKQQVLDGQQFSPAAISEQLSIVVMSFDSFRSEQKEGRKVYQENGSLQPFSKLISTPETLIKDVDNTALIQVFNQLSPVVIVDESHHTTSRLSIEMLRDLNPSFILDLTATPRENSNIISYVDAAQLKAENMVKLPVVVYHRHSKEEVIVDAIDLRNRLDEYAQKQQDGAYIRPLVLFQAQPKQNDNKTTFEQLKRQLIETGIPEEEIAIKTVTYFYGHFSKRRNLIHYSIKPNIPIDIGLVANNLNNLTPATLKLKEMIFDYVENHKNAGHFIVAKFILILKFFFGSSYSQAFHKNGFHGNLIRVSERICKIKRVPCKKFLYGSHFLSICGSL